MEPGSTSLTRKCAIVVIAALSSWPLGTALLRRVPPIMPAYQDEMFWFGVVFSPFVMLGCYGCTIFARQEYWRDFPLWRLLGWQLFCVVAAFRVLAQR